MKLAPRYCRTCGSRILVRNICHDCGKNPLEGNNYCYDCGALTPKETMCSNCGATFKRKTSATAIIISSVLVIAAAIASLLIYQTAEENKPQQTANVVPAVAPEIKSAEVKSEPIKNNPETTVTQPIKIVTDTPAYKTTAIISDTPASKAIKKSDSVLVKKEDAEGFTGEELSAHSIKCSYFEKKKPKNSIIFFTENTLGFIKTGGKIYQLKRTHKTSDIEKFSGDTYEATIEIDGLSGSSSEWLAACTLTLKNIIQSTSAKYKIYSSCIDL